MSKISEIVNLKKHPFIKSNDFVKSCRTRLVKNSILQLDIFLTAKCLLSIQKEALKLKKNAFYCSQKHTILLNKKNPKISLVLNVLIPNLHSTAKCSNIPCPFL